MCTNIHVISLRINHRMLFDISVTGGFTQFERVSSIETLAINFFGRACQVCTVNIFFCDKELNNAKYTLKYYYTVPQI